MPAFLALCIKLYHATALNTCRRQHCLVWASNCRMGARAHMLITSSKPDKRLAVTRATLQVAAHR